MGFMRAMAFGLFLSILGGSSLAQNSVVSTVEDYNNLLPLWGVSWSPGAKSINGYYQTFYTGFAMRSEFPERIHVRTARGNQTRLTVILDENTVSDYLFDLVKRADFYNRMTGSGKSAPLDIQPSGSKFLPHLSYFNQIVDSPVYGIRSFVERARQGSESPEAIYAKGLSVLTALNPGRVFHLRLDLNYEFRAWREAMQRFASGDVTKITGNPGNVVIAINSLVFGRINFTEKPSPQVMEKLTVALNAAISNASDDELTATALDLFKAVTGTKYSIRTLDSNGRWTSPLQCQGSRCFLVYPEFSAIYPTGSMIYKTTDEFGNSINNYATPGLWQFLARPGKHEIDNIRNEPYYGWAPKMDFEEIGNGFHNPAVRFWEPSKGVRQAFGIPKEHNTLWAVKRGGVSHGCLRVPLGHLWEMRQIFPVENSKATKILFFGHQPQDFDIFDINGDGQREVIGVDYMISYGLAGTDGLARREGTDLQVNSDKKMEFYRDLYGAKNIFTVTKDDELLFVDPRISLPSHLDYKKKRVSTRLTLRGEYPLYEQAYEKDKVQFYAVGKMSPASKILIRLMGRVKGCAPTSDKKACGEAAFDQQVKEVVR